jgi:poly(A) polymerase
VWQRRFAARHSLLGGEEVADLLSLPPDASRGEAVRALRAAQARGDVRTPGQARKFLLRRRVR